jgi:hypothetical protein
MELRRRPWHGTFSFEVSQRCNDDASSNCEYRTDSALVELAALFLLCEHESAAAIAWLGAVEVINWKAVSPSKTAAIL